MVKRIALLRKLTGYSFLGFYLYFLFSVSYTANPLIVVLNYLAILTSFSGIILYKMFEIPSCVLRIQENEPNSDFFQLTEIQRGQILKDLAEGMNLHEKSYVYSDFSAEKIIECFSLARRAPWMRIGKIYFAVYLTTVVGLCIYIAHIYLETGFGSQ